MLDQLFYDLSALEYDDDPLHYARYPDLTNRVYWALGPWSRADETGELLEYVRALVSPLSSVDEVVRDTEAHSGWGTLLDVDTAPPWALPWLAQFVGVELIKNLSDESQRLRVKSAAGFHRGTPAAIVAAARQYLTGQRKVELYEREDSPWSFRLRTYATETPNPDQVRKAIEDLKPAGLVLIYEVQQGVEIDGLVGSIDDQPSTIASYSNVVPS